MPYLADTIGAMIASGEKCKTKLPQGLHLGYTPTDHGAVVDHRLVWSRRNGMPSANEDLVLESAFRRALQNGELEVVREKDRQFQTSLVDGWGSSLLIMRTSKARQGELF